MVGVDVPGGRRDVCCPDLQSAPRPPPFPLTPDAVHRRAAQVDSQVWYEPGAKARHHPRRGTEPARLASWLQVWAAVRLSLRQMRRATAPVRCRRTGGRLLAV